MRRPSRVLSWSWLVSFSLACSSSSESPGEGPQAGAPSGGKAGSGATAGSSGQGGVAGGSGGSVGGKSGSSGQAGKGAAAGAAGSGASGQGGGGQGGSSMPSGGQAGQGGGAAGSGAAGSGQGGTPAGGQAGAAGANQAALIDLVITPPSPTLVVKNGVVTPQTFAVVGLYSDGSMAPLMGSWTFDQLDLAQVTPGSGVLTPAGDKGGLGTLTVQASGLMTTTGVTVKLVYEQNPGGVTPEEQGQLETPGSDPGGSLLYPYDRTVFARGLLAPELMWSGAAGGDKVLVHLREDYFEAKFYAAVEPPGRFVPDQKVWDELTTTNHGEDVQVEVVRLSGGVALAPMKETWKIAQGSLRGTIYYWAVNTGQIMKINPGATAPVVAFDSGSSSDLGTPTPPDYNGNQPAWSSGGDGKRCITCHVISKDGSRFAGALQWDQPNVNYGRPWATVDLSTGSFLQVSSYTAREIFFALSPEGKYVVRNPEDMSLHLADAATGAGLSSLLDGFGDKVADPAFSPDGKLLAFSSNATGAYPVEFWRADLDLLDFDPASASFSNRRTIVAGENEVIAFPSFSPDSKHVVYQRGDYSRAKYGTNQHGNDDLYVAGVDGGPQIRLDQANGVGMVEPRNLKLNYQPTVNPIAVGGYYWVVFVSPRDYGNKMVSTSDPSYENHKQLWVAAIDANPQPGQDPSHPAFLLRGQDETTINMSGYWALEPCKQQGNDCSEGFECCTGFCRADESGKTSCVAPPSGSCSQIGEKCGNAGDCCDPEAACIGGFCAQGKP